MVEDVTLPVENATRSDLFYWFLIFSPECFTDFSFLVQTICQHSCYWQTNNCESCLAKGLFGESQQYSLHAAVCLLSVCCGHIMHLMECKSTALFKLLFATFCYLMFTLSFFLLLVSAFELSHEGPIDNSLVIQNSSITPGVTFFPLWFALCVVLLYLTPK